MELPVRLGLREQRRRLEVDEKTLSELADESDASVISQLLDADLSDEVVERLISKRNLPMVDRDILLLRSALITSSPKPQGWGAHIFENPAGDLHKWANQNLLLQSPYCCLDLPNWRGSAISLLSSGRNPWWVESDRSQPGRTLELKFRCHTYINLWYTSLLVSASISKKGKKLRRLTVDIVIQCHDRATYWSQLNSFADAATYCFYANSIQMPGYLLGKVRDQLLKVYQTHISPELQAERAKLAGELAKYRHICRDLHPTIVGFVLP